MPSQPGPSSTEAFIRLSGRRHEPDRYIAAVLAPRAARNDLIALAAYVGDVRRISLTVSDATLGEIRLQWWRDTLEAGAQGGLSGNLIADEMVRVIARHDLPLDRVLAPLDAVSAELAGEASDNDIAWLAYLDAAEGAAIDLGARILGRSEASAGQPVLVASGRAYAAIRLALRLPELAAKGRWPVSHGIAALGDPRHCLEADARSIVRRAGHALCQEARHHLHEARMALAQAPGSASAAILPAALVLPYAKAIMRPGRDALREPPQIAPLTRVSRLWWASKAGRI